MRPWARRYAGGKGTLASPGLRSWFVLLFVLTQARAEDVKSVRFTDYAAQIQGATRVIQACGQNASACEIAGLPGREQVQGAPGGTFFAGWDWLREDLDNAKTAAAPDRATRMHEAQTHLAELAAEAGAVPPPNAAAEFGNARSAANAALARDEFRATEGPTWIQKQLAKLQDWLQRLFTGMDRLGKRAPWLAPAIEWGCFGLAAAGLLWFVRQSLARQALRISLSEAAALGPRDGRDSADWARLARERAAAEDWREAIHCLYWAAIALMEGRRAWKPNATRTPREYLRLLQPGSDAHRALRELTRIFERVWYGHGVAEPGAYEAALQSFRALEAARPERPGTAAPASAAQGASLPAAGGA